MIQHALGKDGVTSKISIRWTGDRYVIERR